jgi:hypothetical protein
MVRLRVSPLFCRLSFMIMMIGLRPQRFSKPLRSGGTAGRRSGGSLSGAVSLAETIAIDRSVS